MGYIPPGGPPRAPGGQKSAHFFGYLITLPVGTEFWNFGQNRGWAKIGVFGGYGGYPWYSIGWHGMGLVIKRPAVPCVCFIALS